MYKRLFFVSTMVSMVGSVLSFLLFISFLGTDKKNTHHVPPSPEEDSLDQIVQNARCTEVGIWYEIPGEEGLIKTCIAFPTKFDI